MKLLSKLVSIEESTLYKLVYILDELGDSSQLLVDLYNRVSDIFEDINEFVDSIDMLYLLNKIVVNNETRVITIAS